MLGEKGTLLLYSRFFRRLRVGITNTGYLSRTQKKSDFVEEQKERHTMKTISVSLARTQETKLQLPTLSRNRGIVSIQY